MEVKEAYSLLSKYQLFVEEGDLVRIFEIQERYEKYKNYSSKRVSEVLEACSSIEREIQNQSEEVLEFRNKIRDDICFTGHRKMIDEMDKEIITQVGKPLSPCPEIENNPFILKIFERYNARTLTQKISALEKERNLKPGEYKFSIRGDWREPKWKVKQLRLRSLASIYLLEHREFNQNLIQDNF